MHPSRMCTTCLSGHHQMQVWGHTIQEDSLPRACVPGTPMPPQPGTKQPPHPQDNDGHLWKHYPPVTSLACSNEENWTEMGQASKILLCRSTTAILWFLLNLQCSRGSWEMVSFSENSGPWEVCLKNPAIYLEVMCSLLNTISRKMSWMLCNSLPFTSIKFLERRKGYIFSHIFLYVSAGAWPYKRHTDTSLKDLC